jgi:hypothetical protein
MKMAKQQSQRHSEKEEGQKLKVLGIVEQCQKKAKAVFVKQQPLEEKQMLLP